MKTPDERATEIIQAFADASGLSGKQQIVLLRANIVASIEAACREAVVADVESRAARGVR